MRISALVVFIVLFFVANPVFAAQPVGQERQPSWTITVDPLTVALGYPHLQIERRVSRSMTVYGGPHLRLFDSLLAEEHEPFYGAGGELAVRWFPFGSAPSGLWLSGRTVVAHLWTYDTEEIARSFGGYSSGLIGFTWIPFGWLVVSGGAGVQYLYYDIEDFGTRSFYPALHTAVGIAF